MTAVVTTWSQLAKARRRVPHEITYEGEPALASALGQMLEEEGVALDWEPPFETRGGIAQEVAIGLAVNGASGAIA